VSEHGKPNGIQYEKTDIDVGVVTKLGIAIVAVTLVTAVLLVPLIHLMKARAERHDPPAPPLAGFGPDRKPPGPLLQERPFDDWQVMKKQQEELLAGYGWVDEGKGVTRITIDDAMRLLAERGVPARPAPSAPAAAPTPGPAAPPAEHHP
jgi:hypothetical protein